MERQNKQNLNKIYGGVDDIGPKEKRTLKEQLGTADDPSRAKKNKLNPNLAKTSGGLAAEKQGYGMDKKNKLTRETAEPWHPNDLGEANPNRNR